MQSPEFVSTLLTYKRLLLTVSQEMALEIV